MMNKKGDIWVSAILYFGLGIIVITIILAAGLPVINKLKDKNIAIQTKDVFHALDKNIREVLNGGPGTQRVVTLDIKKGEFKVDSLTEELIWTYSNSKIFLSEPDGTPVKDGNIEVKTFRQTTKGNYDISFKLNYTNLANINPDGVGTGIISGLGDVVIRNGGVETDPAGNPIPNGRIKLSVSQVK